MANLCFRFHRTHVPSTLMLQDANKLRTRLSILFASRLNFALYGTYSLLPLHYPGWKTNDTSKRKVNFIATLSWPQNTSLSSTQTLHKPRRYFHYLRKHQFRCKRNYDDEGRLDVLSISHGKCKSRDLMTGTSGSQSENIFTIPNILSLVRISLAPVIGYCILQLDYTTALALLGFAGVTDVLDGFIARNFKNQSSVFGSMLDPVADKILMSVLTVSLTWVSLMPVQLCALIVGRDIGLILAVAYLRYKTLPEPLNISRYFDFNLPTVQMKPTQISKYNTGLQLGLVGLCLAAPVFGFQDSTFLHAYWYLVGTTTVLSGLSYVANKNTFKIIQQKR